jgi:hypothetical protein
MNKQLFLYLMTAVCLLFCGCKDRNKETEDTVVPAANRTSLHENHLLGAVQSVTDTKYMVKPLPDGRDSLLFFSTKCDTYNQAGWLNGSVLTDANGDTIFVMKVSFDAKGHMTLSEFFDAEGQRKEHTEYEYDSKGYRVKESHYLNDSLTYEHVCANDPSGNVEQITVNQGGDTYYMKYFNNDRGLPVRIEWISPRMGQETYQQNTIEYDAKGNIINRTATLNGRNVEFYHAQYNDNGHLLKEIYQRSEPTRLEEIVTEYSKHDKNGNWTHQENSKNGARNYVIDRTIEYYH